MGTHLEEEIWNVNTTYIWIDDIYKISFLSITAHFINDKSTLHHCELTWSPFSRIMDSTSWKSTRTFYKNLASIVIMQSRFSSTAIPICILQMALPASIIGCVLWSHHWYHTHNGYQQEDLYDQWQEICSFLWVIQSDSWVVRHDWSCQRSCDIHQTSKYLRWACKDSQARECDAMECTPLHDQRQWGIPITHQDLWCTISRVGF